MKRLALLVLCAIATPAAAEINMADSVEWQTIDSDVVVRGFATAVTKHELPSGKFVEVTVKITESLKGGQKQTLRFAMGDFGDPKRWVTDKTDLLLFLVEAKQLVPDNEAFARFSYGPRPTGGSDHSILALGNAQLFTSAFTTVTKPTEVLAAVRGATRSHATKSHRVDVPWNSAAGRALYSGSAVWMTVPVDAALEKLALAWIADKHVGTRADGAEALAHFKSDANIARMKKLLDDSEFAIVEASDKPPMKHYLSRAKAHEALSAWHVPHATPVLEEPIKVK